MTDSDAVRSRRYRQRHRERINAAQHRHYHDPKNAAYVLKKLMRQQTLHHQQRLRQLEQEAKTVGSL